MTEEQLSLGKLIQGKLEEADKQVARWKDILETGNNVNVHLESKKYRFNVGTSVLSSPEWKIFCNRIIQLYEEEVKRLKLELSRI